MDVRELKELGYQVTFLDIKGKSREELKNFMFDKDVLWVRGGNSYYLLKYLKESKFDEVIKDFIASGKPYIGVSAGSYIICPTIELSTEENKVDLNDLSALGIVPFLIKAHYTAEDAESVKKKMASSSYPIRILTDNQAFLVEDDDVSLVGEGEEVKFQLN